MIGSNVIIYIQCLIIEKNAEQLTYNRKLIYEDTLCMNKLQDCVDIIDLLIVFNATFSNNSAISV
jgi:hypothetical protein